MWGGGRRREREGRNSGILTVGLDRELHGTCLCNTRSNCIKNTNHLEARPCSILTIRRAIGLVREDRPPTAVPRTTWTKFSMSWPRYRHW